MLAYAQCMRDNGVEQFAEPKPGEGINIGPEVVEDPDFEAAENTCNDVTGFGDERVPDGTTSIVAVDLGMFADGQVEIMAKVSRKAPLLG